MSSGIKEFTTTNIPWLLGISVTILNLYIVTLLAPLKQDIGILAATVEDIAVSQKTLMENGSIAARVNTIRIDKVEENIIEIKQALVRIEDRLSK